MRGSPRPPLLQSCIGCLGALVIFIGAGWLAVVFIGVLPTIIGAGVLIVLFVVASIMAGMGTRRPPDY